LELSEVWSSRNWKRISRLQGFGKLIQGQIEVQITWVFFF
jgi:hypothetical protein